MTPILAALLTFWTGNNLLENCGRTASGSPSVICQGYVMGLVDAERQSVEIDHRKPLFCVPNNSNSEQITDVVRLYLESNPNMRAYNAAGLVQYSLKVAFPCGESASKSQ